MKNNDPMKPTHLVNIETMTDEESLNKMALASWNEFKSALCRNALTLDLFARWVNDQPIITPSGIDIRKNEVCVKLLTQNIAPRYEQFREEFRDVTGIGIQIRYHDSKTNGSPYDDVSGVFFVLDRDDLYRPTKNLQQLSQHLPFFGTGHYIEKTGDET